MSELKACCADMGICDCERHVECRKEIDSLRKEVESLRGTKFSDRMYPAIKSQLESERQRNAELLARVAELEKEREEAIKISHEVRNKLEKEVAELKMLAKAATDGEIRMSAMLRNERERNQQMVECLEKNSKESGWDAGHNCDFKVRLQAVVSRSEAALSANKEK